METMATSLKIIGVLERGDSSNYALESTTEGEVLYLVPSYEKDWLEKFLNEEIKPIDNYPKVLPGERKKTRLFQELLDVQHSRLLLWREARASIDGTLRQCNRVIEDIDMSETSASHAGYSFSRRSAHIDVTVLFFLFQRGIELLERFNKRFGSIANDITHGGSKHVLDTIAYWFNERKSSIKLVKYIRHALCHADDFYSGDLHKNTVEEVKKLGGNIYMANWLNIVDGEIFVGVSSLWIDREYCKSDDEYNDLVSKALANNLSIQELRTLLIKSSKTLQYTELDHIFEKRLGL